jgi:RNA polymerase sigma factor (sigma-70 family)
MDESFTRTTTTFLQDLFAQDKPSAWEFFDKRYRPLIAGYSVACFHLTRDEAEEAAQETLARFSIAFREGKYVRGKGRLRSWLMGMARHVALDTVRARRGEVRLSPSDSTTSGQPIVAESVGNEAVFANTWDREQGHVIAQMSWEIVRGSSRFDERTLRAFELTALRDIPAQAAAAQCGMSVDEVYVAKTRVTRKLQQVEKDLRESYEQDE